MIVIAKRSVLNLAVCSVLAAATLSLNACSSLMPSSQSIYEKAEGIEPFGNLQNSVTGYQELVDSADSASRFDALILLARSQIVANKLKDAAITLNALEAEAQSPVQKSESSIVRGMLLSKSHQSAQAAAVLGTVDSGILPRQAAIYYYVLAGNVQEKLYSESKNSEHLKNAFSSKKNAVDLLSGQDRILLTEQCVNLLSRLSSEDLVATLNSTIDVTERGYIEYAIISKSSDESIRSVLYEDFLKNHPEHPCAALIKGTAPQPQVSQPAAAAEQSDTAKAPSLTLSQGQIFSIRDGSKVAVLLPLSGRFAREIGEPARLGIMSALQARGSHLKVAFYDTNKESIQAIAASLEKDGTELIIGPILKPEVAALNAASLKIPSITFNRAEGSKPQNQWFFDLGPDYEGALAASKIAKDGGKAPLVIASGSKNSQRAIQAFRETSATLGHNAQVCSYSTPDSIRMSLGSCDLTSADAVYISAPIKEAISVKAMLPAAAKVYLTNQSYEGYNNTSQEFDMKGALLGDMPWLLTDSELKNTMMKGLPKASARAQRIFAAAYDSINFAYDMQSLSNSKGDVLHGLSGDISLGSGGLIETSPMWVTLGQFR